jgi:hypothetical protein
MTKNEKKYENKIIGKLKLGGSVYLEFPYDNIVIRISSHFPASSRLALRPPTKDYDNVFWILVRDFINCKRSGLDKRLFEAVNLIDLGDTENGNAIIKERIDFIAEDSGKNIAYSITGANDGEITAEIKSVSKNILTFGFPQEY